MSTHQREALAAYRAAMGGVALPTTDEQLSTFHSFSREDAIERYRESAAAAGAMTVVGECRLRTGDLLARARGSFGVMCARAIVLSVRDREAALQDAAVV